MRKPFNGEYKLTQRFNDPLYRASYLKFGLLGHNGLDFGLPTGTTLLAPHRGKIVEAAFDAGGYGWYYKIENEDEGSILAHLQDLPLKIGTVLSEGDFIGKSDNTGNSTGPHLHWGYYRLPRNRDNGFNGYIDQTDWLNAPIVSSYDYNNLKTELNQLKLNQEAVIKEAVNSAISANDALWQPKLTSANEVIRILKENAIESLDWRTLLSIAFKKMWASKRT